MPTFEEKNIYMLTRRDFVKNAGLLTTGILAGGSVWAGDKKQKVGLQMYTLRNVINPKNAEGIIARVAGIGYKEIEIFGYNGRDKFWGMEPKAFKTLLKSNKLTSPSAHIAFENFLTGKDENEFRLTCEAANIVENKYLVVAWLPEQYRKTVDDYKVIATKLNKAATIAHQYGLQLAYHNHDFEFQELETDTRGFDILLKEMDPALVQLELDIYWTIKGFVDPLSLFEKYPGRFPLWHVKDLERNTGDFTEVGSGSIDYKTIFQQKKQAGLKHFFIEQDEVKKDVFQSIQESFQYTNTYLAGI